MSHVVWLASLETLTSKSNCHIPREDVKCESSLTFVSKSHQDTLKHSSQEQRSHLCFLPFLFFSVLSHQPFTSILLSNILSSRCQFFSSLILAWLPGFSKKVFKKYIYIYSFFLKSHL